MAQDRDPFSEPDAGVETSGTAVGLALERARSQRGESGDIAADRFLARQEELIAKQLEGFEEQQRHLRLKHWSERLKLTLQVLTLAVGLGFAGVLAAIAWEAHEANSLVIRPFSVPPALAARGVTGEAVASQLMDRLAAIASISHSSEPQRRVAGDLGPV